MDEIRYNRHQRPLRVALVGGGRRCSEMLEMVALGELKIEVIGVADINQDAPGIKSAREKGIYTTSDYKDLYKLEGLYLIMELTGDRKVYEDINQTKPHDVQVVGYIGARLLWDVVSDERRVKDDYITLAEGSLTGIYIYQDQRLRFVNERFAEMFGYAKEELVGMEVWNLIHPQDREILRGRGEKRLKGEDIPSHYECRGVTKDGTTVWLDVRATVIEYKGKPAVLVNTQDITQRKRMEEALKESEEKYRRIFETSKDVLYLTSREGRFIDINQAGVALLGYSKKELLNIDLAKDLYVNPKDRKRFQEMIEKHGFVKDYEVQFKKKDGTKIYVSITANVRKDVNGEISGYEGIIRDITESKRLYEQVKVLADRDPLTDLFNYRRINELLEYEIERAKRGPHIFSIMMLDVDDLKLINDSYGHIAGDKVLKDVAAILRNASRSVDSIGRYGGDEFLMILPYTDGEKAKSIAQRISGKIQQEGIKIDEKTNIPIRLSIGVATYPFDSIVSQDLISLADRSMYESKRSGRSVVSISTPEVAEYLAMESPSLGVLEGLVTAVDGKDHYTKSHSDLVTKFSLSLGKEMNLSRKEMEALRVASLLHDIGKIGIPESILRKPGSLEEEEFEIIKQHPRLGAMMLDGPPPHREYVLNAIMYHHERYDGKGYPGKLKGKGIPLLARIIGIVDAYSAMTTNRPYRKAFTKHEAIAELKKGAGTQFDPDLVSRFIKYLKEGRF